MGEIHEAQVLEGGEAGENRRDGRAAGKSDAVLAAQQGTEIKNRREVVKLCVCVGSSLFNMISVCDDNKCCIKV